MAPQEYDGPLCRQGSPNEFGQSRITARITRRVDEDQLQPGEIGSIEQPIVATRPDRVAQQTDGQRLALRGDPTSIGVRMRVHSLGIQSDLIFHRRNGEILDREAFLLVRTPAQPAYFWGNYLIYPEAPTIEQLPAWEEAFHREFSGQPLSTHRSFTWDAKGMENPLAPRDIEAFAERGYEYDVSVVLAAEHVNGPRHPNVAVEYRPLIRQDDWEQMLDLQLECREEEFAAEPYREFLSQRVGAWRRLVDAGSGVWFGAFDSGQLVADAGLFWEGTLGRFQNVETRWSHRRRGICGTLVHQLSQYGLGPVGLIRLVMQADEDYHAARIYESLGFQRAERIGGLCAYDRNQWGTG